MGVLENARCQIQIDIGFGDAVTPGPENAVYPVLLSDFKSPKLSVYPRYTVVAEKFEALTILGIANSRMKDYFDLWTLSQYANFDGGIFCQAIQETFTQRGTYLSDDPPFGLTDAFALDSQKQIQWKAFLRKNQLESLALAEVINHLNVFFQPIYELGKGNTVAHRPVESWRALVFVIVAVAA